MTQRYRHADETVELESLSEASDNPLVEERDVNDDGQTKSGVSFLGISMAIASSFFFSLSSLIVKLVPNVHPVALATYRFAGILLPSIPIVIHRSQDPFPKGKRLLLLLRAFLGTTSLMSQFYALRHMPLADASVIIFSVPVFVAIFARIFLKVYFCFPCEKKRDIYNNSFTGGMWVLSCLQYLPDTLRMHSDCPAALSFRDVG